MNLVFFIAVLVCTTDLLVFAYKILGIFPHAGKSHFDGFQPLLEALASKGHEVTVISHFPQEQPLNNYKDISLKGTLPTLINFFSLDSYKGYRYEDLFNPPMIAGFGYESCVKGLSSKQMQDFLKINQTFDLLILQNFGSDCYMGIAHKFNVPFISVSNCNLLFWHFDNIGNPVNPSYIPVTLLRLSDRMSFLERVENTLFGYIYQSLVTFFLMDIPNNAIIKKYFGRDAPNIWELKYNTSLILENVHFSWNYPKPLVPSLINVGGLHIRSVKQLPKVSTTSVSV